MRQPSSPMPGIPVRSSRLPRCPRCGGNYLIDWDDLTGLHTDIRCMLCGRPYVPARAPSAHEADVRRLAVENRTGPQMGAMTR